MTRLSLFQAVLLLSFLGLGEYGFAQIWQPLGPDNREELNFAARKSMKTRIFKGQNDTLFVALCPDDRKSLLVKKFDGSAWDTVGASFQMTGPAGGVIDADITIDKDQTLYVFYSDLAYPVSGEYKASVKKYINGGWVQVGAGGFTAGAATQMQIATDTSGTPYVVFSDPNNGAKPTVMKYDGTAWVLAGNANFSAGSVSSLSIVIDSSGLPYVAFRDNGNLGKGTVMKLSGGNWVPVGSAFSAIDAQYISFCLDHNGNPWVSYQDNAYAQKATVAKFDGSNWQTVGNPGFTAAQAYESHIVVDANGDPYVVVTSNNSQHMVVKYDGTNWVQVGGGPVGSSGASNAICILSNGMPAIAYNERAFRSKVVAKKYNGISWSKVGTYSLSVEAANFPAITTNSSGTPFLVFRDSANGNKASVMNYDSGTGWAYAGTPGLSVGTVDNVCIARGSNDTLFIAFRNLVTSRAEVMRFDGISWIALGSGSNMPSPGLANYLSLVCDAAGVPYLAFSDLTNSGKAAVRKFTGGQWIDLGLVSTVAAYPCIRIASSGEPYVACHGILVKFSGNTWQQVGPSLPVSTGKDCLAFGQNDVPYISGTKIVILGPVSWTQRDGVVAFNGSSWIDVGPSTGINANADEVSITMDTAFVPYIATKFEDKLTIRGFNGTSWVIVNGSPFGWSSSTLVSSLNLHVGAANDLYAAYTYGGAYVFRVGLPAAPPSSPMVASPVYYCLGDTATPLIANGQNVLWYTSLTGTGSSLAPVPNTTAAGTFKWYVSQSYGIWESIKDSIIVTVFPKPVPPVFATGATLHTSPGYLSYQWLLNGVPITNAVDSFYTVPQNGDYAVTVTDSNGCSGTAAEVNMTQPPPPLVGGPVYYCQNDSSVALTATGQNLTWYDSIGGPGNSVAPIPQTTMPGTKTWYVSQTPNNWESQIDSVTVIINPAPQPNISLNGGVLETGVFAGYQWYENGTAIPGATSNTFSFSGGGSFAVLVNDSNGCSGMSLPFVITGLGMPTSADDFVIYPNPASVTINIIAAKPIRYAVYSLDGRELLNGTTHSRTKVDIDALANGVYLLQVRDEAGILIKSEKIIKN